MSWEDNIKMEMVSELMEIRCDSFLPKGPPKRWYPTATLHGITTQKTSI
jgi:hypothetical protein